MSNVPILAIRYCCQRKQVLIQEFTHDMFRTEYSHIPSHTSITNTLIINVIENRRTRHTLKLKSTENRCVVKNFGTILKRIASSKIFWPFTQASCYGTDRGPYCLSIVGLHKTNSYHFIRNAQGSFIVKGFIQNNGGREFFGTLARIIYSKVGSA